MLGAVRNLKVRKRGAGMRDLDYDNREELVERGRELHSEAVFRMFAKLFSGNSFNKESDGAKPFAHEQNCKA